jgi:hypothetical protein
MGRWPVLSEMDPYNGDPLTVSLEVGGMAADAASIEILARSALNARRCGYGFRLCHASGALADLIELAGLSETLGVQPRRQAEQWEQPVRAQEEGQLLDAPLGELDDA